MIINKIQNTHFSESEATIVRYILKEADNIENMTIQEIADATYTSAPLLIRISKKLGFHGWSDFKQHFLEELKYTYQTQDVDATIPFIKSDDISIIANNILTLHKETVEDTRKLLKHDSLNKCFSLLRKAKYIDLYAKESYEYQAQIFVQKLLSIRKNVHMMRDIQMQAAMSNEDHVAIMISYSGETKRIIQAARKLVEKKTPIIVITSISKSTLVELSDVALHMSSREMLNTKIADFASSESINCLLDILYAGIFSFDYEKNLDDRIKIASETDDNYSEYEYIDEDV